jgi:hypothetical protein
MASTSSDYHFLFANNQVDYIEYPIILLQFNLVVFNNECPSTTPWSDDCDNGWVANNVVLIT